MRPALLKLLRCPGCLGRLQTTTFVESPAGNEIVEGELRCGCGASYPIVDTIPRMLLDAYVQFPEFAARYRDRLSPMAVEHDGRPRSQGREAQLMARTRRSFGYQWTVFPEMVCDFRNNFWNYLSPATPADFRGRLGLDAGCGFGRHLYHAASCEGEMVGLDFSRAIDSTRQNTKHLPNVHLVQADIYHLPFAEGVFDFIYSVGVLHHLPDPARGVRSLAALLKRDGSLFVWLYSSRRKAIIALLETLRQLTTRLPHHVVRGISWVGAAVDWFGFVLPYRAVSRVPVLRGVVERLTPARVKVYSRYPFQVSYADWFDRLAAPIRFYYEEEGVRALVSSAGLSEIQVSPTGLYGWRACGIKRSQAGDPSTRMDLQTLGTR